MKGKFVSTIIVCLMVIIFLPTSALGMGFWNTIAKTLIYHEKQVAKQNEHQRKIEKREQARKDKAQNEKIRKEREEAEEILTKKELEKIRKQQKRIADIIDNPLDRPFLQKIEVYEELAKKAKSKKDLDAILEHINKQGFEKYGENTSQKHKELYEKIEKIKKDWGKGKKKQNQQSASSTAGFIILAGAVILARIIFKVPIPL